MSTLEKAKEPLRNLPKDYIYDEARQLLSRLGFEELLLHKPHPKNEMSAGAVKALANFLKTKGDL